MAGSGPIHYVLRRFPKLTETFVVDEILGLEASGEEVIVDSMEPPLEEPRHPALARLRAPIRYVPEDPPRRDVRTSHFSLALRRPVAWLRTARRARREGIWPEFRRAGLVARRCRAERARHVHTHFAYYPADVGGLAAALAGRPFSVTAHANDIWQVSNAPHLGRRLSAAVGVVTPTEYNAKHLRGVAPDVAVHVLPYAVSKAEPVPAPADGPVVCVARLVPKKGIDTLIGAFSRLAQAHPDLRLEVIGDGYLEAELRGLAARLGVEGRTDFRGARPPDAVREAYERCSVFALPCRIAPDGDRDGLPVVLLEALARALPVVTSDVIGISEVVEDRRTGLLVPPERPDALASAIEELLADRPLAARLGAAGRQVVRGRMSEDARVAKLRRVFAAS